MRNWKECDMVRSLYLLVVLAQVSLLSSKRLSSIFSTRQRTALVLSVLRKASAILLRSSYLCLSIVQSSVSLSLRKKSLKLASTMCSETNGLSCSITKALSATVHSSTRSNTCASWDVSILFSTTSRSPSLKEVKVYRVTKPSIRSCPICLRS